MGSRFSPTTSPGPPAADDWKLAEQLNTINLPEKLLDQTVSLTPPKKLSSGLPVAYARILFVDFSSAFNAILRALLQDKLFQLNVNIKTQATARVFHFSFIMGSSTSSPSLKCSICLDVFTQPVSTPCGHNFCKGCLDTYWSGSTVVKCPLCQQVFSRKPELRTNVMLRDLLTPGPTLPQVSQQRQEPGPPRDVQCGPCAAGGRSMRAVRSCLHCEESYCSEHVRDHQRDPQLLLHELLGPVSRLQTRVCKQHASPLDLVCHDDLTAVCVTCINSEHLDHTCVPLKNRLRNKKAQLAQELGDVQQKIQARSVLLESFTESMNIMERNSVSDIASLMKFLKPLEMLLKVNQGAVVTALLLLKRKTSERTEKMKKKLQNEVRQLESRQGALKSLSQAEDGLHLLQNWGTLGVTPHLEDWSHISQYSDSAVGTSRSALAKMLVEIVAVVTEGIKALEAKEVQRVQQYAVQVTLDMNTAHTALQVSSDDSEVCHRGVVQPLPDHPQRFDTLTGVLSKQGYFSGAFYFEVQVEEITSWEVGIALETVDRKGPIKPHLSTGFAILTLLDGTLTAGDRPPVEIRLPHTPQKIGIFVNIEEGEVGFYDVSHSAHIYSFTNCRFPRVKLHPYLNPSPQQRVTEGRMVLTPVTCAPDSQSEASSSSDSDSELDLDLLLSQ
ncbi:E3 ubiquitin-protein ligase TRIM39-like [Eucyclogobius newberryi]|uniref:E3 ubiquitin-protein ligase TRIM39-like n=1 Tax=Eucyclogobius newberryi TaxID=166745 RepID=UPI003B5AD378